MLGQHTECAFETTIEYHLALADRLGGRYDTR